MAKKSPAKAATSAKKKNSSSTAAKPAVKSAAKPVAKAAAKAPVKVTAKPVAKTPAPKAVVEKKSAKIAPSVKPTLKTPAAEKPALMTKKGKEDLDQGDMLIEMARNEMSAHNGTDPSKAEKVSKFKPIKVERGNLADEKAKWQELYKRYGKEKAVNYKMTDMFESLKPIQHKVLGWGFVLTNENSRLEVLFENGIKMLISNYKPS